MNKQEAIEKIKNLNARETFMSEIIWVKRDEVLDIVNQLDEPEKPVVPQFVAEWIEDHKGNYSKWDEEARADFVFRAINDLFSFEEGLSTWEFTIYEEFSKWTTENAYEFITAILFDYTVKKEKLYTVEIPNPNDGERPVLFKNRDGKVSIIFPSVPCWREVKNAQLTEAEIKKDFEWAWQFAKEVEK
ncbi:hypothetical protein CS009_04860 [Streptococcus macedonicus]|uniref:DUF1642 domain-containing protein n=1 Tax=Streptococcus macedonicus TaxID=59310 RepID=A0AAP8FY26_STRMC|nr:DUF1642 domain-containing protein [Streptococcus macedonicus]PHV57668.1 hypothetical protein CS009_04860 [Streptococcus macedonicus]